MSQGSSTAVITNKRRTLNKLKGKRAINYSPVEQMAFTTIGHGFETSNLKKVPPGCILVMAANSGNTMLAKEGDELQRKLMDINNRTYVLNPSTYQREIFDLFGPVTIFKEGDFYPEMEYHLLEYMRPRKFVIEGEERSFPAKVSVSGLIGIESTYPVDPHLVASIKGRIMFDEGYPNLPANATIPIELTDRLLYTPLLLVGGEVPNIARIIRTVPHKVANTVLDEVSELNPEAIQILSSLDLPNFFRFSSFPSSEWVNARLAGFLRLFETPKKRIIMDSTITISTVLEYISRQCIITQQELFSTGGSGVYYNFVCRTRANSPGAAIKQRVSEAEAYRKTLVRAKFRGGHYSRKN